MAREAEVAALVAIGDVYQTWTVTSDHMHRQVGPAAERHTGAPVDSLRAEFNAQLAVARAVAEFARTCPDAGPDVGGLSGAAFIQALHHVGSQPDLDQGLADLTRQWQIRLAEIGTWAPETDRPPPARPTSDAHTRVLAAVDDWWGFGADRLHEQVVDDLSTAQGRHVVDSIGSRADGEVIHTAHVLSESDSPTRTHGPSQPRPQARWRTLLRSRGRR